MRCVRSVNPRIREERVRSDVTAGKTGRVQFCFHHCGARQNTKTLAKRGAEEISVWYRPAELELE